MFSEYFPFFQTKHSMNRLESSDGRKFYCISTHFIEYNTYMYLFSWFLLVTTGICIFPGRLQSTYCRSGCFSSPWKFGSYHVKAKKYFKKLLNNMHCGKCLWIEWESWIFISINYFCTFVSWALCEASIASVASTTNFLQIRYSILPKLTLSLDFLPSPSNQIFLIQRDKNILARKPC